MLKKNLILGIVSLFSALMVVGLLFCNISIKREANSDISVIIAKNMASADPVWGCCDEDPEDTCRPYGADVYNCDECFIFANCNKGDKGPGAPGGYE